MRDGALQFERFDELREVVGISVHPDDLASHRRPPSLSVSTFTAISPASE